MAEPAKDDDTDNGPDSDGSDTAGALLVSEVARTLATLETPEHQFIHGLLEGLDADTAAHAAGWTGRHRGAKVLGRPRIKTALQAIAPYLPVKVGSRLIAPYILERLTGIALNGTDAQSLHAARDLLNLAGLGPVSRSESVTANLSDIIGALEKRRGNESPAPVTVDVESKRMVRR